ncbi:amino acid permease-domain-containing protein [Kalaharituber pfeilii]|nr:amino acid permease-domain-containing protein [Kalaharituber pfeilii]
MATSGSGNDPTNPSADPVTSGLGTMEGGALDRTEPSTPDGVAHRLTEHHEDDHDEQALPSLTMWDVVALTVNKMVGTGIFTAPPLVLLYTQNKGEALGLWIVGFIYTYLSMIIYIQFAKEIPDSTGGELIYLDAAFPKPKLLFYTVYALPFIILDSTATNALQFGAQVFRADLRSASEDPRLVRYFAVSIATIICLAILFSVSLIHKVNKTLAFVKVVGMIVLFGAALRAAILQPDFSFGSIGVPNSGRKVSVINQFLAFLHVLFSYSGWENATFVKSEIKTQDLRRGLIIGATVVGGAYILINIAFLMAIGDNSVLQEDFHYAAWLFGDRDAAKRAWAIGTAISAAGSMGAITYTSSKVKQSIAAANILPWSRFWIREHTRAGKYSTPEGGLLLHWIFCVLAIVCTAAIGDLSQAISFPTFLQVYAQRVFGVFIYIGYLILAKPTKEREESERSQSQVSHGYVPIVIFLVLCNICVLVLPCVPPYKTVFGAEQLVKGYVYPVVTASVILFSLFYYFVCFWHPEWSIITWAGLRAEILSLCNQKRNKKFGYMQRVFIFKVKGTPGHKRSFGTSLKETLQNLFGVNIHSTREKVDRYHPGKGKCSCPGKYRDPIGGDIEAGGDNQVTNQDQPHLHT